MISRASVTSRSWAGGLAGPTAADLTARQGRGVVPFERLTAAGGRPLRRHVGSRWPLQIS